MGFQHLDTSYAYADMRNAYSQDLSIIETAFEGYSPISGGDVVAGTNAGTVKINAGVDLNNSLNVTISARDNIAVTADASLPRFAYVEVDNAGTATVNLGTAAVAPVPPTPTAGRVVHALLYMLANTTSTVCDALLTTANGNKKIIDRRCMRTSMDVQLFTTTGAGTWTKMPGIRMVYVFCIGGGGGGGSGSRVTNATTAGHGGAGAGQGGMSDAWIPAALLGSTEALVVGAAGAGGAVVSTNTQGQAGGAGGASSFGTNFIVIAAGGGLGSGGIVGGAAGGTGGTGNRAGVWAPTILQGAANTTYALNARKGGTGAIGTTPVAAVAGAQDGVGPGAGGGGGGNTTASANVAAGAGANGTPFGFLGAATSGGAAGAAATGGSAGAGQAANFLNVLLGGGGGGGGGGANAINTAGGTGGAGGKFGGGGGGGGSGVSTGSSGAGGAGGDGAVLVIGFA